MQNVSLCWLYPGKAATVNPAVFSSHIIMILLMVCFPLAQNRHCFWMFTDVRFYCGYSFCFSIYILFPLTVFVQCADMPASGLVLILSLDKPKVLQVRPCLHRALSIWFRLFLSRVSLQLSQNDLRPFPSVWRKIQFFAISQKKLKKERKESLGIKRSADNTDGLEEDLS